MIFRAVGVVLLVPLVAALFSPDPSAARLWLALLAAAEANGRLTEQVLEFARTQQALRAACRVEPARSHAGTAPLCAP